jgi:hypothetical protein
MTPFLNASKCCLVCSYWLSVIPFRRVRVRSFLAACQVVTGDLNVAHCDGDVYNAKAPHLKKQAGCTEEERSAHTAWLSRVGEGVLFSLFGLASTHSCSLLPRHFATIPTLCPPVPAQRLFTLPAHPLGLR